MKYWNISIHLQKCKQIHYGKIIIQESKVTISNSQIIPHELIPHHEATKVLFGKLTCQTSKLESWSREAGKIQISTQ
jgi:hypothetical protein